MKTVIDDVLSEMSDVDRGRSMTRSRVLNALMVCDSIVLGKMYFCAGWPKLYSLPSTQTAVHISHNSDSTLTAIITAHGIYVWSFVQVCLDATVQQRTRSAPK